MGYFGAERMNAGKLSYVSDVALENAGYSRVCLEPATERSAVVKTFTIRNQSAVVIRTRNANPVWANSLSPVAPVSSVTKVY